MSKQFDLRSHCPIAATLDILGDKWTLLIIRDMMFFEAKTFKDFQNSPESISTNTLANRLQRLEVDDIIHKSAYQENPIRYEYQLTKKGLDLMPLLKDAVTWGQKHVPGVRTGKKPPKKDQRS